MKAIYQCLIAAVLPALCLTAMAHDYRAGELQIEHPWAYVAADGITVAPVYMIIRTGARDEELLGGSAPGIAEKVELRGLTRGMNVDPVEKISIPAGRQEQLKPHAAHLILVGLKKSLKRGEQLPLTLHFKKAGKVPVKIMVEATGYDPLHSLTMPSGTSGKAPMVESK